MSEGQRGLAARLGIVALNLVAPGLGLLRLGRLRAALGAMLVVPSAAALLLVFYLVAPDLGFAGFAAAMAFLLLAVLGAWGVSFWLSWRWSRQRTEAPPVWSRWYAVAAAGAALFFLNPLPALPLRDQYRIFYLPAEGMEPTLLKGDRLVGRMGGRAAPRRGEIILLEVDGDHIYIKRVAALAGDRIAMEDGVVILNGVPVPQRPIGSAPDGAHILAEQFPGEAVEHRILDRGYLPFDDFAETIVRPGHVFVLGDNRDMSADSRVPVEQMGVEQVALEQIRGRPLFYWFGSGSDRRGKPVQ